MGTETKELIKKFTGLDILVFGDLMLDWYLHGVVNRISPEAPVPVLHVQKQTRVLGGAANVANNINAIGGKATLVGWVGDDVQGSLVRELLAKANMATTYIATQPEYPTVCKARPTAGQQLLRIDFEDKKAEPPQEIITYLPEAIKNVDLVIVSDYAKGTITKQNMEYLKALADERNIPILVDPRPRNADLYEGVFLVKPNIKDGRVIAGFKEDDEVGYEEVGDKLKQLWKTNVLLTMGPEGMALFDGGQQHFPTKSVEVYDVSGAGDTVIATAGLALAAQGSLDDAIELANHAAGAVVKKRGTATITSEELYASFS